MSIMAEPGHTKFNLTYPPLPYSGSPVVEDPSSEGNADSIIPGILFGILVPHIVCTVIILARAWSRLFLLRKWFLDDTLILLAWIFSTAVCIVYSIAAKSPGIHATMTNDYNYASDDSNTAGEHEQAALRPYMLRTYIGLIFYQLCLCLTKLSILTFYLRIFSSRPVEKRLAWATVILVLLYGCPLLFISVFQCHPTTGHFFGTPMKCFTFVPMLIASTSLHTATDAWLIVLIIPCIIRLADLPPRQKAALALVLSLGIFVIAASLTRLQLSLRANYRPEVGDDGDADGVQVVAANTLAFFVMTVLELDLALICASAPTLRPVLARFWPRLMGLGEPDVASSGDGGAGQRRWVSDEDGRSVDLTSVVSYHGYPWTQPSTPLPQLATSPSRSKNPSMINIPSAPPSSAPSVLVPPVPPLAVFRTPTTLSLRSFMSSIAPRSRGHTTSSGRPAEDRTGLLDGQSPLDEVERKRRSSVGFEGYYDQYMGYNNGVDDNQSKRRSRNMKRYSGTGSAGRYSGRWGDSQESFVLGMNDPNSPTRLSPILSADSGLRGGLFVGRPLTERGLESRGKDEEK
ncbi:hypothetical protein B0H63DRAFT_213152 [Podospora didyma]|uniref:Rhodopsin domain-containing protein n=1 Tax=Podospora didyma TaxID=330526 RepID=A0AAE0TW47_9PEZI|nr:hypothetical protein B0H63DRAFT_213152 [Podospora didyma]